jgi:phosphohistidine phosphatase
MKTLLLLRHAKSDWDNPNLRDFERPLNERGRKAAPLMGEFMRERNIRADLILCSPAERAGQTAALVSVAAGFATAPRFDRRSYEADGPRLLEGLSELEDAARVVLLVGHNPGLEGLLEHLTGQAATMPTAALALVSLDIENWNEIREHAGRLEWLVKPKELAAG